MCLEANNSGAVPASLPMARWLTIQVGQGWIQADSDDGLGPCLPTETI